MAFKHGSIGLIVYFSSEMKIPTTIKEVTEILPRVLRLCYNALNAIKSTAEHLDDICGQR